MANYLAVNLKDGLFGTHPAKDIAESPTDLLSKILPNAYVAAGVILLFLLIFAGILIITSAGNPDKAQQGQKVFTSTIIGFLIIFASYWIIQIIQVITGVPILKANL